MVVRHNWRLTANPLPGTPIGHGSEEVKRGLDCCERHYLSS